MIADCIAAFRDDALIVTFLYNIQRYTHFFFSFVKSQVSFRSSTNEV